MIDSFKQTLLQTFEKWLPWFLASGLRILLIIVVTAVTVILASVILNKVLEKTSNLHRNSTRLQTLQGIILVTIKVISYTLAVMLILGEVGIELGPLVATAGVVGLAIGFGSKELVRDIISGFFILLEDQIRVGDVVNLDGNSGSVEKVGLRTIVLRDLQGTIHYVRNGNINVVKNLTKDYSFAVFDIGISYDSSIDKAIEAIETVGEQLRSIEELREGILDNIQILGLDKFLDSAVVIKARIKTIPGRQWATSRAFNKLLKQKFEEVGVSIPFPQQVVHYKNEKDAPNLR